MKYTRMLLCEKSSERLLRSVVDGIQRFFAAVLHLVLAVLLVQGFSPLVHGQTSELQQSRPPDQETQEGLLPRLHGLISIQEAEQLAKKGKHQAAESIYDQLLADDPNNIQVRLNRAFVRAWQGKHDTAQADFLKIIETQPEHLGALIGLGYDLAWSRQHQRAQQRFQQALDIAPDQLDAKKGQAFAALWAGDSTLALQRFEKITGDTPDDPEAWQGLAQAQLASRQHRSARTSFQQVIALDPMRPGARGQLEAVRDTPTVLEATLWGGYTYHQENSVDDAGLRSAELAGWPSKDLRLWLRYDNALTLDNPGLVRAGDDIPSTYVGALLNWGGKYTSRLEVGTRELSGSIDQSLYQAEHVTYLPDARTVKVGGYVGPRDDDSTDWNIYSGFGFPANERLRLEPNLFYTKIGGSDEREWRFLLAGDYQLDPGWRVSGGAAYGRVNSNLPSASGGLWSGHVLLSAPLAQAHRVYFLLRHESPASIDDFTTLAIGVTFRLEGD